MKENKVPWFDKSNGAIIDRLILVGDVSPATPGSFPIESNHVASLLQAYDLKCAQLEAVEKAEEVYIKSKSA